MGRKAVFRLCYYITIFVTIVFACVAIAGACAKFISPAQNNSLTLFGLFLPVVLIINAATLIYWMCRFKIWFLIPLIAIGTNYNYLNRIFRFPFKPNIETQITNNEKGFIIGTYNVHSFNKDTTGYYCRQIGQFMQEQEADIVCFQEFGITKEFNTDSLRAALSNWNYSCIPFPKNKQPILNIAVFSKYPIINGQLFTYSDSKNCGMWCDLDINGDTIRLFNIHLETTEVSQTKGNVEKEIKKEDLRGVNNAIDVLTNDMKTNFVKRSFQADFVATKIEESPYPTILCGDFNSIPSSYAYRTVKGKHFLDGFQTSGHGYMYTFNYFKHLLRIDYIFNTADFKGINYYSKHLDYSDHNPVIMQLTY